VNAVSAIPTALYAQGGPPGLVACAQPRSVSHGNIQIEVAFLDVLAVIPFGTGETD
jgi:hypothetical protein